MPEQSTSVRHQHQLLQPCSCSHIDLTKVNQNASRRCCPGAGDVACPPSKMQARVRTTLLDFINGVVMMLCCRCTLCVVRHCGTVACRIKRRSQEFVSFSLLGEANHTNLYKNLIKIQMFNINLGSPWSHLT